MKSGAELLAKKYISLLYFTGLFKLQDLVKSPPSVKTEMYIRQAGPRSYRQVLREVRHKEIFKLIVDTDPAHMQQFFRAVSSINDLIFDIVVRDL